MDLDKIVALTEKYLREFILYIVSFFWKPNNGQHENPIFDDLNRSVIFAIISAIVGSYLWNRYIVGGTGKSDDVIGLVVDNLLRWISLGLLLFGLLRLASIRLHILTPILSVLKIFSVAHVTAIYAAYVIIHTVGVFTVPNDFNRIAQNWSVVSAYVLEILILWTYFPRESGNYVIMGANKLRTWVVTILFLTIVTVVVAIPYSSYKCRVLKCNAVITDNGAGKEGSK